MILDFDKFDGALASPRVLVVGAGAAGIVLAVALARRGVDVLLCEAGGRSVEPASQALNDAVLRGRRHAGIAEGRGRLLGGTTTLWGGQLISFREIDFRARPWLGLDAWPITRGDVAPYYEAVATMLGLPVRGDDDALVWEALGLTRPELGTDVEFVLTRWLKEANLARAFRSDLEMNPKLTVLLHATATSFVPGADSAIRAVTLRSPGGRSVAVEADHVVVATGTIEASRLMLAAAQQDTTLPWANNPHVGAAFQDHLDVRAAEVTVLDRKRFSNTFDNIFLKGFKYNPKVVLAPHVQEAAGITNVGAVFTFESSLTEHLSNLKIFLRAMRNGAVPPNLRAMPAHLKALAKIWWPLIRRYLRDNRAFNPADLGISLRLHCEQKPIARSRITLDSARTDANGMPLAVLDWQIDGIEVEAMAICCERVATALAERGLARLEIDPRILARDPAILDDARDTNHHCGGLRMAASPRDGVVDADCRVHGTKNLYVAGAAVYPSSSFANPTFTAMALALRLADRIAGQA
ncbi:FAD-dependent oxidoreductase [Novosphingobium sp. AP12]|uniref:FAD-dependent oxidoreductase n=1 Tax=Novosphingobium sp. AP12 TaxID=1144305 RepID=UPI00027214B5|nr:GMC family oxidoreductase [Novosphingobium sp. AP12]EJL32330.1 choline dehydrogenase-like flavoprotein [Novosphingobium sp. AP12]